MLCPFRENNNSSSKLSFEAFDFPSHDFLPRCQCHTWVPFCEWAANLVRRQLAMPIAFTPLLFLCHLVLVTQVYVKWYCTGILIFLIANYVRFFYVLITNLYVFFGNIPIQYCILSLFNLGILFCSWVVVYTCLPTFVMGHTIGKYLLLLHELSFHLTESFEPQL